MFLSTGLKWVRLLGMGMHFFPKKLARALWHNFVEEMKMHALCSNFDGSVPLKGLSRSHQTIWRLLLMGPTNILHQYCLNET